MHFLVDSSHIHHRGSYHTCGSGIILLHTQLFHGLLNTLLLISQVALTLLLEWQLLSSPRYWLQHNRMKEINLTKQIMILLFLSLCLPNGNNYCLYYFKIFSLLPNDLLFMYLDIPPTFILVTSSKSCVNKSLILFCLIL